MTSLQPNTQWRGVQQWQLTRVHDELHAVVLKMQQKPMTVVNTMNMLVGIAQKNGLNTRVLMVFLEQIVAGPDGVLGTDDDLLPASVVKAIQSLLSLDATMVEELLTFMFDVAEKTCASWWKCCVS